VKTKGNENLVKIVGGLREKDIESYCNLIHQAVVDLVKQLQVPQEKNNTTLNHFKSICILIKVFIDQENVVAPKAIYDSIDLLQGIS
jgi:hypothetical protein